MAQRQQLQKCMVTLAEQCCAYKDGYFHHFAFLLVMLRHFPSESK